MMSINAIPVKFSQRESTGVKGKGKGKGEELPVGSVLLSKPEHLRIRRAAGLDEDPEVLAAEQKERDRKALMETASLRKTRILKDKEKLAKTEQSDMDMIRKIEGDTKKEQAIEQIAEGMDEAKKMNEHMNYARAVTIRDQQKLDKIEEKKKEEENEVRWANLMEAERVEDIKRREAIETAKAVERKEDAKKIVTQIKEKRLEREKLMEEQKEEGEKRLQLMELEQQNELKKRQEQAVKNRLRAEEIARDNKLSLEKKAAEKQKEIQSDLQMMEYQKAVDRKEYEREEARKQLIRDREYETARLRALQEKFLDEQAIKDGQAQKRAEDAAERKWRKEKQEESDRRAKAIEDLNKARAEQVMLKKAALEDAEEREKAEFNIIMRKQREEMEKDAALKEQTRQKGLDSGQGVRAQILEKIQKRKDERDKELAEGDKFKREEQERLDILEKLRQKKMNQLRSEKVPEKYMHDLKAMKLGEDEAMRKK